VAFVYSQPYSYDACEEGGWSRLAHSARVESGIALALDAFETGGGLKTVARRPVQCQGCTRMVTEPLWRQPSSCERGSCGRGSGSVRPE
jgi:hypothetical protein